MSINVNHVNEFVCISKLMQSRKKIESKDIREIFLFSLFGTTIMSQIEERVQNRSIFNSF